jgi:hypothetical protein
MTAAVRWFAYDPNNVRPGWGALALVIALGVATFLLWRSMNTQLRRIQMPPRKAPDTRIPGPQTDSASEEPGATDAAGDDDDPPPPASQPAP